MKWQELVDALDAGRGIWCTSCFTVRIIPAMDFVSKGEAMRVWQCPMCQSTSWRPLTVEMLRTDPRFKGIDEPK